LWLEIHLIYSKKGKKERSRDHCLDVHVPFFFNQWGGGNKKKAGRLLDGRTWDDMPMVAGVKEFKG